MDRIHTAGLIILGRYGVVPDSNGSYSQHVEWLAGKVIHELRPSVVRYHKRLKHLGCDIGFHNLFNSIIYGILDHSYARLDSAYINASKVRKRVKNTDDISGFYEAVMSQITAQ